MKINWFSPLPPARTGIADYTFSLLPELVKNCRLELWTTQRIHDREIDRYVNVNYFQVNDIPWEKINRGDINIYHIGNNLDFHREIWQISLRCPGIVVLHDFTLQDFFYNYYLARNDRDGYISEMLYYYGIEGEIAAERFLKGELSIKELFDSYPLTPLALKNALAVVNHSRENHDRLKDSLTSAYIPLPHPVPVRKDDRAASEKNLYHLVIFGYIGKNRRVESILEAFAGFDGRNRFRLDIYGEVWDEGYLNQKIKELNLESSVKLHGFVNDGKLDEVLADADLAFNLRFPSMGEASLSQLRLWSHALPTLVTRIGWYGELPEETIIPTRPDYEIEDIRACLTDFLQNPDRFREIGDNGYNHLKNNHDTEVYARSIVEFARMVAKEKYRFTADYFIERVRGELDYWNYDTPPEMEVNSIARTLAFFTD